MGKTLTHAESRRLYSWWWDGHTSIKNSKWLQDNIKDMDIKVKAMIKLLEEDADSFARRAEMYYKKRPELLKLVEEFYRAYRAIAERYDHATGALRQAHRTMAEAFPNQIPFALADESPRGSPATEAAPHTPEISPKIHSTFKENDPVMSKKGLKQLNENVWSDEWRVRKGFKFQDDEENSSDYKALQEEISQLSNGNQNLKRQVDTSEAELQSLKEIISRLNSDKEAAALQHQISLERISTMETEISHSKEELAKLNLLLEEEHQGFMQAETARLSLEELHSRSKEQENFLAQEVQDGAEKLRDIEQRRVILEEELLRIKEEICVFKVSSTKREDELRLLTEEKNALQQEVASESARADQSEAEVRRLEELISQLNSEKEAAALQHQISLERISTLETEISHFKEELEKLKSLLELEHQGFMQAETARLFLEELHSQSQEQERLLALEIQAGAEKLKDIEQRRVVLEEELQRTKEEINVFKVSSTKQEDELRLLTEVKKALQQDLSCLKEDINTLEQINQRLSEQLEAINLNAESLQALVKELQSQNVELHEICKKHESEKVTHLENNVVLENSLSDANVEIETLREKIKGLEQSCELLCGEVALHLSEKAALVSQVQVISQNLENISQRSVFLEKSLSDASVELEGSSGKLRASEEFCQSLCAQNSSLLSENSTLVSQVEGTIQILEELEARFVELEDKHLNLEREKDLTLNQVMELEDTLKREKEEYETLILSIMLSSNSQISTLEHQISLMEEEGQLLQEEFEEQEVKFMDAEIEILILQRSLCDINEKNSMLSSDSCKLVEANSELKKKILVQEKNLTVSEERNEKLSERIQLMQDENQQHLLEKLVFITTLEQFGLDMMDQEMDKIALARESQIKDEELLVLQSKELELLEMNEQLRQDLQALRKERDIIEEENYIIVEEALFVENLYLIYKNASAERVFELESASNDLACIHGVTDELNEENGLLTEKLGTFEVENVCLKETVLDLYKNLNTTRSICEKLNLDIESGKIHLAQKEIELLSSQDKITELCRALDGFQLDIEGEKVVREELDKKVVILSDDNARREIEISCLRQENESLNLEHERSRKEVEDLRSREEQLTFELKKEVNEVECCEVEIETLLKDIQFATLNEALFEEKVFELLITCERLEIMVREELANKVFSLSENAQNESEILRLHQANEMLNWEINRLHKEVEDLRSREEGLTFELQKEVNELEYCEFEMATLIEDIQFATVNELLFEEKVFELLITCERLEISAMVQREKLYEEISIRNGDVVELNEKLGTMEGENRGLKGELNSYLLIVADLWDDISSLEEEILSLAELYTSNHQKKKGNELVSLHHSDSTQEEGEFDSATASAGILQLQNLHVKVRALKKVVIDTGSLLKQETFESSAPEIVELSRAEDAGTSNQQMMKDIQLDLVLSSSPHMMDDAGSSDQALDSWETIEAESSNIEYHTIEEGEEGKRRRPSHELAIEREPSIDKLELPKKLTESHQEWDRMIVKRLSSDAQRLAVLETSVQDLKKSMEASDMSSCPTSFEFDRIKAQLKEAEESVSQMIDVNSKLTKKARDFSEASMDLDEEEDEVQSKSRRQISELARRGLDRIGRLELELQKIQYLFLKLDEEHESKRAGAGGRRRVLLKDYLYGRMDSRRRKRGPCGCIRPRTRDD